MKTFSLLIILSFIGCSSTQQFNLIHSRAPNSRPENTCHGLFTQYLQSSQKGDYRINIDQFEKRILGLSQKYRNQLKVTKAYHLEGRDSFRIDLPARNPNATRVIITAGVHGNESVAPMALLDFIEKIVYDPAIREQFDFVFYPNISAGALERNSRYLEDGTDPNRTFFAQNPQSQLARLFVESVKNESFDVGLDMHEAYTRPGFFVIRAQTNDDEYLHRVLSPLDQKKIVHSPTGQYPFSLMGISNPRKVSYSVTAPGVSTSYSPGTLKDFLKNDLGLKQSYTLEASGQISLSERISFYVELLSSFIKQYSIIKREI